MLRTSLHRLRLPLLGAAAAALALNTSAARHVFVTGDSYTGPGGGDYRALTVALRERLPFAR